MGAYSDQTLIPPQVAPTARASGLRSPGSSSSRRAVIEARNIADTVRSLARTPYVAAEVLYQLQGSISENFGVLNAAGNSKPAFAALSGVLTSPFSHVSPVTLSLRRRNGHHRPAREKNRQQSEQAEESSHEGPFQDIKTAWHRLNGHAGSWAASLLLIAILSASIGV